MRRFLFRALLLAVAALLLALAVAGTALQREPAVPQSKPPALDDVGRALALLRAHDPRRARSGAEAVAGLGQRDLEVLLDHGAWRWLGAATQVELETGAAVLTASVPLPDGRFNPFGRWVNLQARLVQTESMPALESWRIGRLPLPAWLGERVLAWAAERSGLQQELQLAADVVRRVEFRPGQALVVYAWRPDSANRVAEALLSPGESERLRAYNGRLVEWASRQPAAQGSAPAAPLLSTLFALARDRSAQDGADAAAENRAAIVALALYANGRRVDRLLPAARSWPRPRPLRLLLAGRTDFALHFVVSAALAVAGTGPLSQAIGTYAEVADSRGGSGFSFQDMAANLAGTRFGELAMSAPAQLQARVADGVVDDDLVPAVDDLPEFMPEAEFVRRYGGVGAPAYRAQMAEIDRRVGALRSLR